MKNLLLFILISFILSRCHNSPSGYQDFLKQLEPDKQLALEQLIISFDVFLLANYPDEKYNEDRIYRFLKDIETDNNEKNPILNNPEIDTAIVLMEESGLRKDIFLYKTEEYGKKYDVGQYIPDEPVDESPTIKLSDSKEDFEDLLPLPPPYERAEVSEKDMKAFDEILAKTPFINKNGLFLYALAISNNNDPLVSEYVMLQYKYGSSQYMLAFGLLTNFEKEDYNQWFIKLIIVVELYYPMILWNYRQ